MTHMTATVVSKKKIETIAYKIAEYLDNLRLWKMGIILFTLPLCFVAFWMYGNRTSPAVPAYHANVAAAEEFVISVDSEWFFNRPLITEKLRALKVAYKATGEGDPGKLGELRRLEVWTSAATSVADQQQYLSEVRSHGHIVMKEPFYVLSVGKIIGTAFLLLLVSAVCYILLIIGLSQFSGRSLE